MKTVVVTPEDISPTKPDTPSWQLWARSLSEGSCRTKRMVFSFLRKWRLQMRMLSTGDTAVASAAPGRPRPMGNMKI